MVILITGKANAGKTTLAKKLRILSEGILLDGDEIREIFPCGFTDKDREEHIKRIANLAALFERQKKFVIVSAIMPYK